MSPLLTVADVAEILHKSQAWVSEAARAKTLPGRKVGRIWCFTEADVQAFIDGAASVAHTAAPDVSRRRRRPQAVSA